MFVRICLTIPTRVDRALLIQAGMVINLLPSCAPARATTGAYPVARLIFCKRTVKTVLCSIKWSLKNRYMWHTAATKTASAEHLFLAVERWSVAQKQVCSRSERSFRCICNWASTTPLLSLCVGLGRAAVVPPAAHAGRRQIDEIFAEDAISSTPEAAGAGGVPNGHLVRLLHAPIALVVDEDPFSGCRCTRDALLQPAALRAAAK